MKAESLYDFFWSKENGKLKELKEFISCGNCYASLKAWLELFMGKKRVEIWSHFPMLRRFGLYFKSLSSLCFTREYLPPVEDYVKVTVRGYFFLHYKKNK